MKTTNKIYIKPQIEVINLENIEVIATSLNISNPDEIGGTARSKKTDLWKQD